MNPLNRVGSEPPTPPRRITPYLQRVLLRSHHAHFVLVAADAHVCVVEAELATGDAGVAGLGVAHEEGATHLALSTLDTQTETEQPL